MLAAVATDDPPASADHRDDDEWHAAQDMWLVKWSGSVLPDGPQRRLKWKDQNTVRCVCVCVHDQWK